MSDYVKVIVEKWLDDNELDYVVAEVYDDVIMLRPNTAGDLPIALLKTSAGWQPFVWHDPEEEGWTDLHALDEVTSPIPEDVRAKRREAIARNRANMPGAPPITPESIRAGLAAIDELIEDVVCRDAVKEAAFGVKPKTLEEGCAEAERHQRELKDFEEET